jgi:signal transduction histidine kinase
MNSIAQKLFQHLLLISILSFGLITGAACFGLYSLWGSVQNYHQQTLPKQSFATDALDVSIEIRLQVQEWKNLLLRSTDQTSLATQWKKFVDQERIVQIKIQDLIKKNHDPKVLHALKTIQHQHHALNEQYRLAMQKFVENGFNAHAIDQQIIGIDRPLDTLIDALSDESALNASLIQKQTNQIAHNSLYISIIGLALGVLIASTSFYFILKIKVLKPTQRAFAELETATELLIQSERMAGLSQLVAGVAHEINTPVGITLTCATSLQEQCKEIQSQIQNGGIKKQDLTNFLHQMMEGCNLIASNAYRSANLVKSFKQIATDQSSEHLREFEFDQFLDEVLISLNPEFKHTQLNIVSQCTGLMRLESYPGALGQVVTNLLLNAKRHAFINDAPGTITIKAHSDDEFIEIEVIDNGAGISKEHLAKVFDPFFTTKRNAGGTGLGLNIVYNLVTQTLGGTIRLLSELGQGTQFVIRIPKQVGNANTSTESLQNKETHGTR